MTKKELLENRDFQMLPDDAEIVFNTAVEPRYCFPVSEGHLMCCSEIDQWCKKEITEGLEPVYKTYLVVNARPYKI